MSPNFTYYGIQRGSCGYCHQDSSHSSISYGAGCSSLKPDDYEKIMLISWRRSGNYFYKPLYCETCCPQYTIRLKVDEFQLSKSHKKTLKRLRKDSSTNNIANPSPDSSFYNYYDNTSDKITIEIDRADFTEEKFNLYKDYQMKVHRDEEDTISHDSFIRFLCDSPLEYTRYYFDQTLQADIEEIKVESSASSSNSTSNFDSPPTYLDCGSFHHLYRYEGKLIAVGVVDVLPSGLSSVYFFYDNDLNHQENLNLGKYSSLREISFIQNVLKIQKNYIIKTKTNQDKNFNYNLVNMNQKFFANYYLGFYIHNCVKMKYKREYKPSQILCPYSLKWIYLDETDSIKKLNKSQNELTSSKILDEINSFFLTNHSDLLQKRKQELKLSAQEDDEVNPKKKRLLEEEDNNLLVSYSPFTLFSPLESRYFIEYFNRIKELFKDINLSNEDILNKLKIIKKIYLPNYTLANPSFIPSIDKIKFNLNDELILYSELNTYGKEYLNKFVREVSASMGEYSQEFIFNL